jgi:hypothetical protein
VISGTGLIPNAGMPLPNDLTGGKNSGIPAFRHSVILLFIDTSSHNVLTELFTADVFVG